MSWSHRKRYLVGAVVILEMTATCSREREVHIPLLLPSSDIPTLSHISSSQMEACRSWSLGNIVSMTQCLVIHSRVGETLQMDQRTKKRMSTLHARHRRREDSIMLGIQRQGPQQDRSMAKGVAINPNECLKSGHCQHCHFGGSLTLE